MHKHLILKRLKVLILLKCKAAVSALFIRDMFKTKILDLKRS